MGTHADRQSPWARFRQWRAYRRVLARLVRRERRAGRTITPFVVERLKRQAREAARRGHE